MRNAVLARSLSGPNPDLDVADVYIKLWSAIIPEPAPDEVYVKITLYSTDQHRLVDCIFPGGSGTTGEGALEYKSVVWQKTSTTSVPVFGDLVRFRVARPQLKSGHVQFAVMGMDRGSESTGLRRTNERVVFTVELPLAGEPDSDLWLNDGEHHLVPPEAGHGLTVRSLSLVPFGFKDINLAYVFKQLPGDISVDRISLLRYAPVDELKRHADRLLDHLLAAMLQEVIDFTLHAAIIDVLTIILDDETTQNLDLISVVTAEMKQQAVQLVLEAVSLALSNRSRRHGTMKSMESIFGLCRHILGVPFDRHEAIEETLLAVRMQLIDAASSRDDHVGQTLALKHWPFATFGDPDGIIKVIDRIRPNTAGEHKSKMRFIIQAIDELPLDDSLVAALWRHIKASVNKDDEKVLEVIHLATSAIGRIIDAASVNGTELQDALEYIGVDLLRTLLATHKRLAAGQDQTVCDRPIGLLYALSAQSGQVYDSISAELVKEDIRACIAGAINCLSSMLDQMLSDLDAGPLNEFVDLAWAFFISVPGHELEARLTTSFGSLQCTMWLRLCRIVCRQVDNVRDTGSFRHLATVVDLIKGCHSAQTKSGASEGENDAVEILQTVCRLGARPGWFSQIIDLALVSKSAAVRRVCHEALLSISAGGPTVVSDSSDPYRHPRTDFEYVVLRSGYRGLPVATSPCGKLLLPLFP